MHCWRLRQRTVTPQNRKELCAKKVRSQYSSKASRQGFSHCYLNEDIPPSFARAEAIAKRLLRGGHLANGPCRRMNEIVTQVNNASYEQPKVRRSSFNLGSCLLERASHLRFALFAAMTSAKLRHRIRSNAHSYRLQAPASDQAHIL